MLIVSRGYYSLTYLFSYLFISIGATEYRLSQSLALALALEAKSFALALRVVALTPSLLIS